jgi:hypothetical protein
MKVLGISFIAMLVGCSGQGLDVVYMSPADTGQKASLGGDAGLDDAGSVAILDASLVQVTDANSKVPLDASEDAQVPIVDACTLDWSLFDAWTIENTYIEDQSTTCQHVCNADNDEPEGFSQCLETIGVRNQCVSTAIVSCDAVGDAACVQAQLFNLSETGCFQLGLMPSVPFYIDAINLKMPIALQQWQTQCEGPPPTIDLGTAICP